MNLGVGILLCKAFELLGEDRYLKHAKDAAEVVWERGILKKSDGKYTFCKNVQLIKRFNIIPSLLSRSLSRN